MAFGYFPYDVYCRIRNYLRDRGKVAPDNSLHRHAQHVNVKCTNLLSFEYNNSTHAGQIKCTLYKI